MMTLEIHITVHLVDRQYMKMLHPAYLYLK